MPQFAGQLNSNLVMASMYNMIISQRVFVNNLGKHQTLVDKARVEGSLYGDQKLYTATDVLKSKAWTGDSEASNLLAIDRPPAPYTQSIVMSVYRQIRVTVDYYLSKQFWMSEGAFEEFQSTILGWLNVLNEYTEEQYIEIAQAVKEKVDDSSRFIDWDKRTDIKAQLKVHIILTLKKYNYPPATRDEVFQAIFEQAENFKKNHNGEKHSVVRLYSTPDTTTNNIAAEQKAEYGDKK